MRADLASGRPAGGNAGPYSPLSPVESQVESLIRRDLFDQFVSLCDQMEALSISDLIASSGRQRAVLGQRASGLADRMSEILEGLDR